MLAVYIDKCIMVAKSTKLIERAVQELAYIFEITDEGEMDEYLGSKSVSHSHIW